MQKKKNVPAFLRNTYEMLEREDLGNVVSWAESGSGFVIKDLETFSAQILPQYFKHKKYTSFVRQLNMYGFHKQRHQLSNYHYFAHQYFRRGDSESKAQDTKLLLAAIKRKPEKKKKLSEGQEQPQAANPYTEEVESSSQRSVSMVLEEEKPRQIREKSEELERQENQEEWSEGSSEQVDQITEKVMEQNEILRNLHGLIRAEVLNAKKRSIQRLTSIDIATNTNTKEEEPITKLTQLLIEGAHLIGKMAENHEQYGSE